MESVVEKSYNKYNKAFYDNNKERILQKVKCDICGGSYTYYNKSHHNRGKLHKLIESKIIELQNINLN